MPDPVVVIPPAGVSPLGFFAPVEFVGPSKPPAILADYIDPKTGDFASVLRGMHPVDSQVVTRVRTRRGSGASVRDVGNLFHTFELVDEHAPQQAKFEAQRMLDDLVVRGDITIDDVRAAELNPGDGVALVLFYTNNRTKQPGKVAL